MGMPKKTMSMSAAAALAAAVLAAVPAHAGEDEPFPVAVWLQGPHNAARYKALGVNAYIGLWKGPTAEQVAELEKAGMPFYGELNDYAKNNLLDNPILKGWLLPDEPDNSQPLPDGKGYGPPTPPAKIKDMADAARAADPMKRPVFLNLGWGVAWDGWFGRGERTRKPEDYPLYAAAADIVSFDIYPVSATGGFNNPAMGQPELAGDLSIIASGVKRLRDAVRDQKPTWFIVEAASIEGKDRVSRQQLRDSVWLSLAAGAKGLAYFCHSFMPGGQVIEAAPLVQFPELGEEMTAINAEIQRHKAILLADEVPAEKAAFEKTGDAKALLSERRADGNVYLFVSSLDKAEQKAVGIRRKDAAAAAPGGPAQIAGSVPAEADAKSFDAANAFATDLPPFATRVFMFKGAGESAGK